MVILKSGHVKQMRRIKAERPGVKVLLFKNLTFTSSSWTAPAASGVLYAEAQPDWFLRDGAGQRINSSSYGYLTAMDVGHSGYQQRWTDNVLSELVSQGWDGVFLDDVNPTMKYHVNPARIARYPNDAAWTEATRQALASITRASAPQASLRSPTSAPGTRTSTPARPGSSTSAAPCRRTS